MFIRADELKIGTYKDKHNNGDVLSIVKLEYNNHIFVSYYWHRNNPKIIKTFELNKYDVLDLEPIESKPLLLKDFLEEE